MRIAHIVSRFPALSHTFIENQIVDQIEEGHEVVVYADGSLSNETSFHPDILKHRLHETTRYSPPMPDNRVTRVAKALPLFLKTLSHNPKAAIGALDARRIGIHATSMRMLYAAAPFLDAPSFDITHCHFGPSGVNGVMLQQLGLLRSPLITTFYGYDVHRYPPKWNKIGYAPLRGHPSRILVLSEEMKRQLTSLGFSGSRLHVHHLAIDCARFSFRPRTLNEGEPFRLLSIARLVPKKGIRFAIEAIAENAARLPGIQYDVVGDGPLREELQHLINQSGLKDKVRLHGWKTQAEVIGFLDRAHAFVAPSITAADGDQEGTPTVLMEAMAVGLPVISTLHSGIPEVVPQGAGILVPESDANALAGAIMKLQEAAPAWPEMGRIGRERVLAEFNREKLKHRLVQHYEETIREQRTS